MQASHYIIIGIFLLTGSISLLAAFADWNWFFTSRNSQFLVSHLGRRGARILYGLMGLVLLFLSVHLYYGVV